MAWTPSEIVESRRFLLPVWDPACDGTFVEAGDTVRLLAASDDGVLKAHEVEVVAVSEDGRTISWERVASGNDPDDAPILSSDIVAVHSQHVCNCPEPVNLRLLTFTQGDDTVDAFIVNGIEYTGDWQPLVSGDDVLLEDAINAVLLGNGHATITSNGTVFVSYVMNTTAAVSLKNVSTAVPLVAF